MTTDPIPESDTPERASTGSRLVRIARFGLPVIALGCTILGGTLWWLLGATMWAAWFVLMHKRKLVTATGITFATLLALAGWLSGFNDINFERNPAVPNALRFVRCTQNDRRPTEYGTGTTCARLLKSNRLCDDGRAPIWNGNEPSSSATAEECATS